LRTLGGESRGIHGHDAASALTSERYVNASRIASEVTENVEPKAKQISEPRGGIEQQVLGYAIMALVVLGMFLAVFTFGDYTSRLLGQGFSILESAYYSAAGSGVLQSFIWNGLAGGLIAGTTIRAPFHRALLPRPKPHGGLRLPGSGRVPHGLGDAQDRATRKGIHPNDAWVRVQPSPAILGSNIMETERERLICAFVSSLVPCAPEASSSWASWRRTSASAQPLPSM